MPATTVVTDKATADALPDNPDVVAATPEIVAAVSRKRVMQRYGRDGAVNFPVDAGRSFVCTG